MSAFDVGGWTIGFVWCAGAVGALFFATWLVAACTQRYDIVDTTWGLGFAIVAVTSLVASVGRGSPWLRWLVLACTVIWSLRLATYLVTRMARSHRQDPRYTLLLSEAGRRPAMRALLVIYPAQAGCLLLVSLPVQVAMYERDPVAAVGILGVILWAAGFVVEAVADLQLAQFRRAGPEQSAVMDRGLWRFSRHPNYFGDICIWSGMFTMAAHSWAGLTTLVSPLAMFWLLAHKSGVPSLERYLLDRKPDYAHYMARTSRLVPRPPRR